MPGFYKNFQVDRDCIQESRGVQNEGNKKFTFAVLLTSLIANTLLKLFQDMKMRPHNLRVLSSTWGVRVIAFLLFFLKHQTDTVLSPRKICGKEIILFNKK